MLVMDSEEKAESSNQRMEIGFLRRIKGKTGSDKITKKTFREKLKITPVETITKHGQLRWLGPIMRKGEYLAILVF